MSKQQNRGAAGVAATTAVTSAGASADASTGVQDGNAAQAQIDALQARIEALQQELHAAQADALEAREKLQALQAELQRERERAVAAENHAAAAMFAGALDASQKSPGAGRIRVAALSDGYWRSGQQFSRQPRELALADLSEAQLQGIRGDARLVVVEL